MEKKSIIPKLSENVLRKKGKDPDLPEFQPPSRGKARSFRKVIKSEKELEK